MRFLMILLAAIMCVTSAFALTPIKFSLDWKFEGPAAPYFVALDKGYFEAEGLDVTIDTGKGSLEAIPRVTGGAYEFGFADINSLIKFRDKNPTIDLKGILMVYNNPPFAIISLNKSGVVRPKDLEGKILGAPAPDGAYAQWKAFVAANNIKANKVIIENVGFPVREPMLAAGEVDAITGFSFSAFLNLKSKGVKEEDINVMLMSDYGLKLYGNTVIVNPEFATENPQLVKGFVKAIIRGWLDTIADPNSAIDHLMKRNKIARRNVELERLEMAIRDNVITAEVKERGFGDVEGGRLAASINQVGLTYDFSNKPTGASVFTSKFLPAMSQRKIN